MSSLRLGIIGAGSVGELHARAARELADVVTITAVTDPRRDAAARLADESGAHAFPDHKVMADSGLVDAVVIASPHGLHLQQACDMFDRGLPVLVEKPMAVTTSDCDVMIAAADQAGTVLTVGHVQRYFSRVKRAHELLFGGAIGVPKLALESRSGRYEQGTRPGWFLDPRLANGGILTNLGSHCIDKLLYLSGRDLTYVRSASSWGHTVTTDVTAMVDLEDVAAVLLMTGTGLPEIDMTELVGDDAAMRVSRTDGVRLYRRGTVVAHWPTETDEVLAAFTAQLSDFHASVSEEAPVAVDGAYGRRVISALERIAAAADASSSSNG